MSDQAPPSIPVSPDGHEARGGRSISFWGCWALSAGTMIGSGIFMMPAVLAPYGMMSFGGWALTTAGSIAIALVLGRLAGRTTRSGGMQVYAADTFGPFAGFVVAWSYWIACWISTPTVAIAFVGYVTALVPGLADQSGYQAAIAIAAIWALTLVSARGAKNASTLQIAMTVLKIAPLVLLVGFAVFAGSAANLPPANPSQEPPLQILSATALLTMWAFVGLECGVVPAANVRDPQRTIPRAVIAGTLTAAVIFIASTAAVMYLVPAQTLATSKAPFFEAAAGMGAWGPVLIALGALLATAGSMNGNIFVTGQTTMAAAQDGLAPKFLARLNRHGAPTASLVIGSALASVLLLMNYSRGLVGAFTFLLTMATLANLVPYLFSALAELKRSWRSARGWALIAILAGLYALFAICGSGVEAIAWSLLLIALGVPAYLLGRRPWLVSATQPAGAEG